MSDNSSSNSGSISVAGLLGVAFIVLKIVGIAPIAYWSWWWVLAPFWLPLAFIILTIVVTLLFAAIFRK